MAEFTELERLLECNVNENLPLENEPTVQTDAVAKFMNGEISFGDYLHQMEEISSKNDSQLENPIETVADIDSVSMGSLDDFELSLSSEESFSENDEDSNDEFDLRKKKKNSKKKKKPQRSKLSATLRAVMGQANVCYAKGDAESAVKMCLEIIKEEPNASEPFRTLSSIYEGIGQPEKSLQMRLIAAHLGPTDKEEWTQIATILEAAGQFRQAVSSYTRAIRLDELNVGLYEKRIDVMKKGRLGSLEDYGYHRLLHKLNPKSDGPTVIRVRNIVGTSYYKDKKYEKACEIWKYIFDHCERLITSEEVQFYTDALVFAGNYDECLSVLCKFCGISVNKQDVDGNEVIVDVNISCDISTNIRIKLTMCLLHYNSFDLATSQIKILLIDDSDKYGLFFYEIVVILLEKNQFDDALLLLKKLSKSKMNSSDICLKITHCYKHLNQLQECFAFFRIAINMFPDDSDLKLKFCDELKSAGLYKEAVEITLENQGNISVLIYERCQLYYLLEDYDAFIEATLQLFRLHYIEINTVDDFTLFESLFRTAAAKGMREKLTPHPRGAVDLSVPVEKEWQVFLKVCNLYIERGDYDLFQRLVCSLWLSFKFIPKRRELRLAMILACIYNKDFELGFDLTRHTLLQPQIPERSWSLFYLASHGADYSRMHKFFIRLLIKNPDEDNALMLFANSCLFAGTYKYALNDYTILYEKRRSPLLALLIALNLLHISCQKFTTSRHVLVTQMVAFLTKYQEERGSDASQEVFYNIGRAFHQIELLPQAIFYYKKALSCKPAVDDRMFDLTPDIAFNLHLIYLNSGQLSIANSYLQKYIVI